MAKTWRCVEMRAKLTEILEEEESEPSVKTSRAKTEYQSLVQRLNQASNKKVTLTQFVTNQLGMAVSSSMAILQIQKAAIMRVYAITKADGTDPVGFGKHAGSSYAGFDVARPPGKRLP